MGKAIEKAVLDKILDRLASGESLRSICKAKDMPSAKCVHERVERDEEFRKQYARAREKGIDAAFDELLETAEKALQTESAVEVQARRLLIDTQKWRLSKLAPKKYGDRLAIGGADDMPAIKVTAVDLTDDQLAAIAKGKSI